MVQNDFLASHYCGYFIKCCKLSLDTVSVTPAWYSGVYFHFPHPPYCHTVTMSSVKQITARKHADKPKARSYGHWINSWDVHNYCPTCRESGTARGKLPPDPCMLGDPCPFCETFTADQMDKIAKYQKKSKDRSQTHRPDNRG